MTSAKNQGFTLVELLVVIGILGILASALFPAISNAVMQANMTAVGTRGRDIYIAITGANTEREPLGLGNVWPKNGGAGAGGGAAATDISTKSFGTSSEYFYDLYDGARVGQDTWSPYVAGFDYSKLAGAGVSAKSGTGQLQPENNMWTIAGNVRDEMEDIIPVLVTRNLDAAKLCTDLTDGSATTAITWSEYKAPFSNKAFVIIRKGGGVFKARAKYATINVVYQNQSFKTTVTGGGATDPLVYLTPGTKVTPSGGG